MIPIFIALFAFIWGLAISSYAFAIEKFEEEMKDPPFNDCTNCVRYFDTVICKCKMSSDKPNAAFMYPTDLTPDIDLRKIAQPKKEESNKDNEEPKSL